MKKYIIWTWLAAFLFASTAFAANTQKPTIGITNFEITGKNNQAENMGGIVSEWLITYTVQSFRLNVIERQKLAKVLEELALSQTGIVNEEDARKIGQLSGAQALLVGTIFFAPDKNVMTINCRLIDTSTGSIKAAIKSDEIDLNEPKDLEKNLKYLSERIIDYFPVEGYVVQIKNNAIVLNAGRLQGLSENMRLLIYETGDVIRDPITQEILEQEIHKIGYAKVTSVGEKISNAEIISREKPIKPKDKFRTTKISEIATSPKEEGIIYFQDKNYAQAAEIFQKNVSNYNQDAEYLYYLGKSLYFLAQDNNDIQAANTSIAFLEKAKQLNQACKYDIALSRFQLDLLQARSRGLKNADNEPFLFVHPRTEAGQTPRIGVVLAHGFTACPWEVKELGEYLFKQGYDVYGVLLAGHGTRPEDLTEIKWEDWLNSVECALTTMRMIADRIYVGGVSTGGTLALLTAARYDVDGVISLASAIYLQDDMAKLASIGKYVMKYNVRPLAERVKPYYYEERAVSAIQELNSLLKVTRSEMKKIVEPVIIFQSKTDKTIMPESANFIYDKVSSKNKNIVWFEASPHVLTTFENKEQQKTIKNVADFIKKTEELNSIKKENK